MLGMLHKDSSSTKDVYAFVCVGDGIAFTGYYCLECEKFESEKCHKCRECYDEEKAYQGYIKECYKQEDTK